MQIFIVKMSTAKFGLQNTCNRLEHTFNVYFADFNRFDAKINFGFLQTSAFYNLHI